MRDVYQLWTRRLAADVCDAVVAQALELPPTVGSIGHGGKTVVRETTRRSLVRFLRRDEPEWGYLFDVVDYLFQEGNRNAFDVVYDWGSPQSLQFTEYEFKPGEEGHYDWHQDLHWICQKQPKQRKLSLVVNLSRPDDYDGGVLELKDAEVDPTKLRTQGTAICFPSFWYHRVTPITRGKRFSLVAWAEGPPYR